MDKNSKTIMFFIATFSFLGSCSFKLTSFNSTVFFPNIDYIVVGEDNIIEFSKSWRVDSFDLSYQYLEKGKINVHPKNKIEFQNSTLFLSSKFSKRTDSVSFNVSKRPEFNLKLFPSDLDDTINFDNIRFLRYYLVSDSNFFREIRYPVNQFQCTYDSTSIISYGNFFPKSDIVRIFKQQPEELVIDFVTYTESGIIETVEINEKYQVKYPNSDNYSLFDDENLNFGTFRDVVLFHQQLEKKRNARIWKGEIHIGNKDRDAATYVYKNKYYMNFSKLHGVNNIEIYDGHGSLIFDRLIYGNNQRIEDIVNLEPYDEIQVIVKGYYDWNVKIFFE